jgi:hypothetical protein
MRARLSPVNRGANASSPPRDGFAVGTCTSRYVATKHLIVTQLYNLRACLSTLHSENCQEVDTSVSSQLESGLPARWRICPCRRNPYLNPAFSVCAAQSFSLVAQRLLVQWQPGYYFNTGGRYDPDTDTWVTTSTINAPDCRYRHTAVWTGNEMMVWGGILYSNTDTSTGRRYCAQFGSPTSTPTPTATPRVTPRPRSTPAPRPTPRP